MLVISDEMELGDLMASDSHNLACILLLRHHAELTEAEASRGQDEGGARRAGRGSGGAETPANPRELKNMISMREVSTLERG